MNLDKSRWATVRLDDVVEKKEEGKRNEKPEFDRFLKVGHFDAESLHIKRSGSQSEEELPPTFYKIFRKGQILYPTRNPHLRRAAIAPFDGMCGEKTIRLEPIIDLVLPSFIPFLFHSEAFYAHTTSVIVGSTNPHVRWRDVAKFEFLLPPKAQQAELAELLWASYSLLHKLDELLLSTNLHKKSVLKDSFLKGNCIRVRVAEISDNLDSRRVPIKQSDRIKGAYPYYGASGVVDYVDNFIFDEAILLISEDGENLQSRKLPIAYEIDEKCWVNNHAHVLRVSGLYRYLVAEYFNSHDISDYITGGTRPKLTKGMLSDMPIYLPREEHVDKVKNRLLSIDQSLAAISKQIAHTKLLMKSLINQIF